MDKEEKAEIIRITEKTFIDMNEKTPTATLKKRISWLEKQINQQDKTLNLEGVTHSRDARTMYKMKKEMYQERLKIAKKLQKKIKNGK